VPCNCFAVVLASVTQVASVWFSGTMLVFEDKRRGSPMIGRKGELVYQPRYPSGVLIGGTR